MKQLLIFFLVVFLINFLSCKKDIPQRQTTLQAEEFKAKINDSIWEAQHSYNWLTKGTTDLGDSKVFNIFGVADKKFIDIIFTDNATGFQGDGVTLKTYSKSKEVAFRLYDSTSNVNYIEGPGSLTITACDPQLKTISGSFKFKNGIYNTRDSVAITEGIFTNIKYSVY